MAEQNAGAGSEPTIKVFRTPDATTRRVVEGVGMRPVPGERLMLNLVVLEPGAVVPLHSHLHEQAGVIVQGELEFTAGSSRVLLRLGDAYIMPSGLPHTGKAGPEGCRALDIFVPPREDYLHMVEGED